MSTFIHHPECFVQDEAVGHDTCLRFDPPTTDKNEPFEGWPREVPSAPAAQPAEAPTLPPPPEPGLTGAAPSGPAVLADQPPQAVAPLPHTGAQGVTDVATWKAKVQTTELELPSGNVCLARKPGGMSMFLHKGMIPNSLIPIVMEHMNDGRQVDMKKAGEEMLEDPDKLWDIMAMAENVLVATVVEPRIFPTPKFQPDTDIPDGYEAGDVVPEHMRDQQFLYADEVDMEDMMFVFQWAVGGTRNLEQFREEQAAALEAVPTSEGVGAEAERGDAAG